MRINESHESNEMGSRNIKGKKWLYSNLEFTKKIQMLVVFTIILPQVSSHDTFINFLLSQEHPEAHPKVQMENTGVRSNAGN